MFLFLVMFSIFKIVQMLKVVHDFGKLVFLSFTIFTVQSVCESGTNALIACNFPHGKDLSQSLPFSLKPKDAKETELSKQIRRHMFFTLHKQFSIFSLDVGHFFLCSASQFPCMPPSARRWNSSARTDLCARRRKMHGLDCSLFRLGSKPVVKLKEIQKCCHTLLYLVPSCSLHLGFRTTLRPRSGMMQPSSQTLEPKMPVL